MVKQKTGMFSHRFLRKQCRTLGCIRSISRSSCHLSLSQHKVVDIVEICYLKKGTTGYQTWSEKDCYVFVACKSYCY